MARRPHQSANVRIVPRAAGKRLPDVLLVARGLLRDQSPRIDRFEPFWRWRSRRTWCLTSTATIRVRSIFTLPSDK